jgi:AcrR family transcriptional regulator
MPTEERRDGRRTDTRCRIQQMALEVLSERGWEGATLKEIADRLEITRPALYYHFTSKEDILASVHAELAGSVDTIIDWAKDHLSDSGTRAEVLRRLTELMTGTWGSFLHFAQNDQGRAMRDLKAVGDFSDRMDNLAEFLRPADTIAGRIKARLALDAIFMADVRAGHLGGDPAERSQVALDVATELVK